MKLGDLVKFNPNKASLKSGSSLTAVKYFARIYKRVGDTTGIIVEVSDDSINCLVNFGEDNIVLNKNHIEVISESR